ncbi:MAG: hypothetical protein AAE977_00340, partial [Thermoplasmataceae archaeon]
MNIFEAHRENSCRSIWISHLFPYCDEKEIAIFHECSEQGLKKLLADPLLPLLRAIGDVRVSTQRSDT